MRKKIVTILSVALILGTAPVNVYADDISGNGIPEIVSETPETVTEDPEIAQPVVTQEPAAQAPENISEIYLDDISVASNEAEVFEEETAEALPEANNTSADFIERLYNVALDRPSEEAGKQDWLNRLNEGSTGSDLAKGFLYSQEFLNKGTSNDQFLTVLYKTFFDRDPDEAGKAEWMKALNEGATRQQIVDGFIGSQEYANLCATYGISAGTGVTPNVEIEPNQATIDFATRLYSTCLNRTPDEEGLSNWSKTLANQQVSGTKAAEGFFFSDEFVNSNINDYEYIKRLYKTFFNREPDPEGLDTWDIAFHDGYSRKYIFNGFAESAEWKQTCRNYGIVAGDPSALTASDYSSKLCDPATCHHVWFGHNIPGTRIWVDHCPNCGTTKKTNL